MSIVKEIAAQTATRRAMLANGYVPLANDDKRCMLKGWPSLPVDDAMIDAWSHLARYRATGVRLEGGLAVADFDIDDPAAMDAIVETMPADLWAKLGKAPVRYGGGAKEALFFRVAEPFGRYCSATFSKQGAADDGQMHVLEVFAGGSARQFGAYGAHTVRNGEVAVAYRWLNDRGLADVPYDDLPVLDTADVEALCDHVTAVLTNLRWETDVSIRMGKTAETEVFDLTDDMTFVAADGAFTLAELEAYCRDVGPVRVSASWLLGDRAVNPTRCLCSSRHDGSLQVLETANFTMHRPERDAHVSFSPAAAAALKALAANGTYYDRFVKPVAPDEPDAIEPEDLLERTVSYLVDNYALNPRDARSPIYPMDGSDRLSVSNFMLKYAPFMYEKVGARGGVTSINPVTLWQRDPDRLDVLGHAYRPDRPADQLVDGWVNTYQPAIHTAAGGDSALFWSLLDHLLPDAGERAWLINKIAAKVQRPHVPGVATLMVATRQGTGRGTLFEIMAGLSGAHNTVAIERTHLTGEGQGQYNDWRAEHVLGFVHELLAAENSASQHWRRAEIYERLKVLIDPAHARFAVIKKFAPGRMATSYLSIFMATNHMNALPIQPDDRRITVLTCGDVKLDDIAELQAIHDVKHDPAFLAAVWRELRAIEVDWLQVMRPLLSTGREIMIEENQSELEDVVSDVLIGVPGDYISFGALRERVASALRVARMSDEVKWQSRIATLLSAPHNSTGWTYTRHKYKIAKPEGAGFGPAHLDHRKLAVVSRRDGAGPAAFAALSMEARRDVLCAEAGELLSAAQQAARALKLSVVRDDDGDA